MPLGGSLEPLGANFKLLGCRLVLLTDFEPMLALSWAPSDPQNHSKTIGFSMFFASGGFPSKSHFGPLLGPSWGPLGGLFSLKQGRIGPPRRSGAPLHNFFLALGGPWSPPRGSPRGFLEPSLTPTWLPEAPKAIQAPKWTDLGPQNGPMLSLT